MKNTWKACAAELGMLVIVTTASVAAAPQLNISPGWTIVGAVGLGFSVGIAGRVVRRYAASLSR